MSKNQLLNLKNNRGPSDKPEGAVINIFTQALHKWGEMVHKFETQYVEM